MAEELVVAPVERELEVRKRFCAAVEAARVGPAGQGLRSVLRGAGRRSAG